MNVDDREVLGGAIGACFRREDVFRGAPSMSAFENCKTGLKCGPQACNHHGRRGENVKKIAPETTNWDFGVTASALKNERGRAITLLQEMQPFWHGAGLVFETWHVFVAQRYKFLTETFASRDHARRRPSRTAVSGGGRSTL